MDHDGVFRAGRVDGGDEEQVRAVHRADAECGVRGDVAAQDQRGAPQGPPAEEQGARSTHGDPSAGETLRTHIQLSSQRSLSLSLSLFLVSFFFSRSRTQNYFSKNKLYSCAKGII